MTEIHKDKLFASQMQDAIFQFLMALITEYRKTLPPLEAAIKAADWMTSLADTIKREAESLNSEYEPIFHAEHIKDNKN